MAKKTHIKVRLVPEEKPDSPFFYYVKKPAGGEKAKVKLKAKKWPTELTSFSNRWAQYRVGEKTRTKQIN